MVESVIMPRFLDVPREKRAAEPTLRIDVGFINHRLILSSFGSQVVELYRQHASQVDGPLTTIADDLLLSNIVLRACDLGGAPSLGQILRNPQPRQLFVSLEKLGRSVPRNLQRAVRARNRVLLPYYYPRKVWLEYSPEHICSTTSKWDLSDGCAYVVVGGIDSVLDKEVMIRPLIMGPPTYSRIETIDLTGIDLSWFAYQWCELSAGDIDEFAKSVRVRAPAQQWMLAMRTLPEQHVKEALVDILEETPRKDWGGEQADHFSASLHVGGKRMTAAFLLKGPSRFSEMTPVMLGKQADQIYRIAQTPARILIVQHCHHIGEAVRETLRAFALRPPHPKFYCLIDGRDTFRILKAYKKLPKVKQTAQ